MTPGLRAGRGLKPQGRQLLAVELDDDARPSGRARIETAAPRRFGSQHFRMTPGLRAGRGLKQGIRGEERAEGGGDDARPSGRARIETLTTLSDACGGCL